MEVILSSQQSTAALTNHDEAMLDLFSRSVVVGKVERIEQEIQALSPDELAELRAWFLEFDWAAWDRQLERDVQAGRLDDLADRALRDHAAGKTTPLCITTRRPLSGLSAGRGRRSASRRSTTRSGAFRARGCASTPATASTSVPACTTWS